jgi:hypothetical protein
MQVDVSVELTMSYLIARDGPHSSKFGPKLRRGRPCRNSRLGLASLSWLDITDLIEIRQDGSRTARTQESKCFNVSLIGSCVAYRVAGWDERSLLSVAPS